MQGSIQTSPLWRRNPRQPRWRHTLLPLSHLLFSPAKIPTVWNDPVHLVMFCVCSSSHSSCISRATWAQTSCFLFLGTPPGVWHLVHLHKDIPWILTESVHGDLATTRNVCTWKILVKKNRGLLHVSQWNIRLCSSVSLLPKSFPKFSPKKI